MFRSLSRGYKGLQGAACFCRILLAAWQGSVYVMDLQPFAQTHLALYCKHYQAWKHVMI